MEFNDDDSVMEVEESSDGSDVEMQFNRVLSNQLSPWCEQGASWNLNWPMIGETPRGREFIAGPPVIIAQQSDDDDDDDDDDDITDRDLFHEALTAPVVDLNFFNSFEDDFDDFDI